MTVLQCIVCVTKKHRYQRPLFIKVYLTVLKDVTRPSETQFLYKTSVFNKIQAMLYVNTEPMENIIYQTSVVVKHLVRIVRHVIFRQPICHPTLFNLLDEYSKVTNFITLRRSEVTSTY